MSIQACTCPDPWCIIHARCIWGHKLVICDDDPAFCPTCGHDVMPAGSCGVVPTSDLPPEPQARRRTHDQR